MANPITSIKELTSRQNIVKKIKENKELREKIIINLEKLKEKESNILWLWKDLNEETKYLFNMVYFQNRFLKWLNKSEIAMKLYNYYVIIFSPIYGILSPIFLILSPFIFLKFYFKTPINLSVYLKVIKIAFTGLSNIFTTDIYAVGHITASGNISASGILTVANIELSPGGAIRPTINNNTIKFAAQDHGSAEFMEIGSDKFNVYMDGRATITLNRSDTEEGQIILNATNDNYDVNIKYDDTSIAFRSDAASHFTQMSGPLVITRSGSTLVTPLGSGFNTVADGNSALQLSGSQFTNGHITASGNISSSIGTGSFGSLVVDGSSVDFTNLPTSDPGIAGRLYNDSGTIKISL